MTSATDPATTRFVRVQAPYRGRLGIEVGICVAVDHLRRAKMLSPEQDAKYFDIDDGFRAHLPNPPFYDDGNSIGPTSAGSKRQFGRDQVHDRQQGVVA